MAIANQIYSTARKNCSFHCKKKLLNCLQFTCRNSQEASFFTPVGVWFCFFRCYHNFWRLLNYHLSITGFHPPNGYFHRHHFLSKVISTLEMDIRDVGSIPTGHIFFSKFHNSNLSLRVKFGCQLGWRMLHFNCRQLSKFFFCSFPSGFTNKLPTSSVIFCACFFFFFFFFFFKKKKKKVQNMEERNQFWFMDYIIKCKKSFLNQNKQQKKEVIKESQVGKHRESIDPEITTILDDSSYPYWPSPDNVDHSISDLCLEDSIHCHPHWQIVDFLHCLDCSSVGCKYPLIPLGFSLLYECKSPIQSHLHILIYLYAKFSSLLIYPAISLHQCFHKFDFFSHYFCVTQGLLGSLDSSHCKRKLSQLPAVNMQHAPVKPSSKLHLFAYVDVLVNSVCKASWEFLHVNCRQLSKFLFCSVQARFLMCWGDLHDWWQVGICDNMSQRISGFSLKPLISLSTPLTPSHPLSITTQLSVTSNIFSFILTFSFFSFSFYHSILNFSLPHNLQLISHSCSSVLLYFLNSSSLLNPCFSSTLVFQRVCHFLIFLSFSTLSNLNSFKQRDLIFIARSKTRLKQVKS
ncbi:hypothetical protein VP01_626g1 [Puccinia sorghi]|uniref:Uncharacterized protein n=1 Tax=Puccinia sorghi TaxID=27349 RepID=A0A0L6UIH8_9BASI|nr:hypothetical protein VP01_626g1 [Puccinia sorghi]